ncbi:hypothetical protein BHM03_00042533, partial [Ensete ventricosum]
CPSPPSPSLRRRRRCPLRPAIALPRGGHRCDRSRCPNWWQGWPWAVTPCGLAAAVPAGGRPLRVATPTGGRALQGAWSQPATPCRQPSHGRPPLQGAWPEIVYPCIPYPDGEDEGGQASSSLVVSTQWISTAKLLQSDLATLAQREGGE